MKITITGANGFIGRRLLDKASLDGHTVHLLLRKARPGLAPGTAYSIWDALENEPPLAALEGAEAVIHLAGEPVAQRWTTEVKKRILKSRTLGTQRLVQAISLTRQRPRVLVCASAIGYYGSRGDEVVHEKSQAGGDFLADVCEQWEEAAELATALGLRVVRLRIGVVLGRDGGALEQMRLPFRLALGGRLGTGEQWVSWIHVEDLVQLMLATATNEKYRGAVNAVAPNPVRNADFTQALALTLRRPAIFPVPGWVLNLIFGEMSRVLLASQRVEPRVASDNKFAFAFPELGPALRDLLKS